LNSTALRPGVVPLFERDCFGAFGSAAQSCQTVPGPARSRLIYWPAGPHFDGQSHGMRLCNWRGPDADSVRVARKCALGKSAPWVPHSTSGRWACPRPGAGIWVLGPTARIAHRAPGQPSVLHRGRGCLSPRVGLRLIICSVIALQTISRRARLSAGLCRPCRRQRSRIEGSKPCIPACRIS